MSPCAALFVPSLTVYILGVGTIALPQTLGRPIWRLLCVLPSVGTLYAALFLVGGGTLIKPLSSDKSACSTRLAYHKVEAAQLIHKSSLQVAHMHQHTLPKQMGLLLQSAARLLHRDASEPTFSSDFGLGVSGLAFRYRKVWGWKWQRVGSGRARDPGPRAP